MAYLPLLAGSLRRRPYLTRLRDIAPGSLIGYWPMDEAGGAVAYDRSSRDYHGAYTAVALGQAGIGDGRTCPSFSNAFNDIYSAGFAGAFNNQELTIAAWARMSDAGVWTDLAVHRVARLAADANNLVSLYKNATNNQLVWVYAAGGVTKSVSDAGLGGSTAWFHLALTVSKSADAVKAYANGVQVGTTQTVLGTWVGALSATNCCIGAFSTAGSQSWSGRIAHVGVWATPLADWQIAELARV